MINRIKIFANPTHQTKKRKKRKKKRKRKKKDNSRDRLSLQVDGWIYPSTTKCLISIGLKMSVTIRN